MSKYVTLLRTYKVRTLVSKGKYSKLWKMNNEEKIEKDACNRRAVILWGRSLIRSIKTQIQNSFVLICEEQIQIRSGLRSKKGGRDLDPWDICIPGHASYLNSLVGRDKAELEIKGGGYQDWAFDTLIKKKWNLLRNFIIPQPHKQM